MSSERQPLPLAPGILAILITSLVCAGLANAVSPRRIAWFQSWSTHVQSEAKASGLHVVTLGETRAIIDAGTHIVFDARPTADYDAGQIPTAMSFPYVDLDQRFAEYAPLLTPEQPILVYCSGAECDESLLLGQYLRSMGFTNLFLFAGGYTEWQTSASGEAGP